MTNIGIKASQKGYNVRTCADHELLFSSGWPLLKIEKQGSITIADKTQDIDIYTHNLGYVPMFFGYKVSGSTSYLDASIYYLSSTSTKLRWLGARKNAGAGSITIYYYIYRYDMTTNFTAPILHQTPTTPTVIDDYGIKISKEGSDTDSADLRDYVVHSSARNLQIHKTVAFTESSIGWSRTITHGLGYEPLFLLYFSDVSGGMGLIFEADQEFISNATSTNVVVGGIPTGDGFVCIFKDPFDLEE